MGSFLSNDSMFGRAMHWVWVVVISNILFAVCSLPIVTFGASYAALYHVMFKMSRMKGDISPFKEFFRGFKNNFKQATICWVVSLLLLLIGYVDVQFCLYAGDVLNVFRYLLYAMGVALLIINLYLYPVMAAFETDIKGLLKDSLYFAINKPLNMILIVLITVVPQMYTYADPDLYALYGFIWVVCGYALVVMVCAKLLLKQFTPFLPEIDDLTQILPDDYHG